jgi:hypothetical protein
MKMLRVVMTNLLFAWIVIKLKLEEMQRQATLMAYQATPRYPVKPPPSKSRMHPLDDPRLAKQRADLN